MAVECPKCGHTNEPVKRLCANCGVNLKWALERGSQYWSGDAASRSPLILASDDEPAMLMLYKLILDSVGYRVAMESDAFAAIELAERLQPDLIITDFMKPGMNGAEMIARIKAIPALRDVPAMMITAGHDYWRISSAVEAGVTRWLYKPFLPYELITIVASVLTGDFLPLVFFVHAETIYEMPASLKEHYRIVEPIPRKDTPHGARRLKPDLVVIGVHPKERIGLDILTELKADTTTRNIPVVMWFEEPEPELEQQAMQSGAHTIYTGPSDAEALAEVFRSVLAQVEGGKR